ncbi:MAG: LysM peptidoglycan-binding domain-containing protein, partial [Chitinophagales bacterium]
NLPAAVQPPPPAPLTATYVVQPGDTFFLIARRFATTVDTLLRLNPAVTDPSRIFPGQLLTVPVPASATPPGCVVYVKGLGEAAPAAPPTDLYRSDALGRGELRLTRHAGTADQPVAAPRWSPDGRSLAYLAGRQLIVGDGCGRNPRRLATDAASFSWSHDSTRLAYSNPQGTFTVTLAGASQFVAANLENPDWFPGDRRLAGTTTVEGIRYPVLATVDLPGGTVTPVVTPRPVPAASVALSPSGRYAATQLLQGTAFDVTSAVWVYDFTAASLVQLPGFSFTVAAGTTRNLSFLGGWAPDSSRLVYATLTGPTGTGELRIASPAGGLLAAIPRNYYPEPRWGPAADWLIYAASAQPGTDPLAPTRPRNIFVRHLPSGAEYQLTQTGDNSSPDWTGSPCPVCG